MCYSLSTSPLDSLSNFCKNGGSPFVLLLAMYSYCLLLCGGFPLRIDVNFRTINSVNNLFTIGKLKSCDACCPHVQFFIDFNPLQHGLNQPKIDEQIGNTNTTLKLSGARYSGFRTIPFIKSSPSIGVYFDTLT